MACFEPVQDSVFQVISSNAGMTPQLFRIASYRSRMGHISDPDKRSCICAECLKMVPTSCADTGLSCDLAYG